MVTFTVIRRANGQSMSIQRRKRRDTAGFVLRQAIYKMLEGEALLDRPIAGQLMTQAQDWEAGYNPKGLEDGKRVFYLRPDDKSTAVYIDWQREGGL